MAISTPTTSGQILTSAYVNNNINSGLVYIANSSFSAVTEILIDSVFTSTYLNYYLVFDCQSSAGGGTFTWQLRSGASTIATTTYSSQALNIEGASVSAASSTGQTGIRVGANDTGLYNAMTMEVFCPQVALPTRIISNFNRGNGKANESVWGANTNSTSYDGIRISVSTGNMTGSYTLYGNRQP